MLDPILKLVFSVTFLRKQNVDEKKAFAAGAAAALIPGPLGLAVPLLVARTGVGPSDIGGVVVSNVAVVPPVIGMSKPDAEEAIRGNKLKPVSKSVAIEGGKAEDKDTVVAQDPKAGSEREPHLVSPGTEVKLMVSLGPPEPAPEDEDLILDREIK
ncbi:MAG: PASTA domain-containing protein [Pseudomonadota bacterium]|nr:PASTA domain-containing protein [Gammaproteobacteria bacterium]MDQ3582089.1 PASTA domain-containing protein [Pseudomonadota bacterium]